MMSAGNSDPSPLAPEDPPNTSEQPVAARPEDPSFPAIGFLTRLVLLPAGVVALFVAIAMFFSWTLLWPKDLEDLAAALEQPGRSRWQAAFSLANLLAHPGDQRIRHNRSLALRLCAILQRELDHGRPERESVLLRMYLCRALGEFSVAEVLPVLLAAASNEKTSDLAVRRAAVEALAVLSHHLGPQPVQGDARLLAALADAAGDADAELRCAAAYALGVVGSREAQETLVPLLDDGDRNVRYNAANALARNGDRRAISVLMEMLELAVAQGGEASDAPTAQLPQAYRDRVAISAVRALAELLARVPTENTAALRGRLRAIVAGNASPLLRLEALELLRRMKGEAAVQVGE